MEILFLLVPLSIAFVAVAVVVFIHMAQSDQFEDLDRPGQDIFMDDDRANPSNISSREIV